MGRAIEKVCRGVRGTTAGGTEVVRAPTNSLQVGVESWREPGPQLGKGGTGGSRQGKLLLCNGGSWFGKDSVGRAG